MRTYLLPLCAGLLCHDFATDFSLISAVGESVSDHSVNGTIRMCPGSSRNSTELANLQIIKQSLNVFLQREREAMVTGNLRAPVGDTILNSHLNPT